MVSTPGIRCMGSTQKGGQPRSVFWNASGMVAWRSWPRVMVTFWPLCMTSTEARSLEILLSAAATRPGQARPSRRAALAMEAGNFILFFLFR